MPHQVLVSGGSGYIAGFLIRQLIADGWMVHTTIRNLSREQAVRDVLSVDNARLKFFAADLTDDKGWAEAMTGCSHVAHVASPLPSNAVKDAEELIVPARDGALRALRAAKAAGVGRVVMTSSTAAICYGRPRGEYVFTENDWTIVDHPDSYPYVQSKTIAERAARDWVAAEGGGMQFCTINPSAVLGPVMSDDYSASIEAIKKPLEGSLPGCPDFGFAIVDVRDVADAHVRALTAEGADGGRFIAGGKFMKMIDICHVLKDRLGDRAKKVPTRTLPDFLVKIGAQFDPVVKQVIGELGKVRHVDISTTTRVLGWTPRDEAGTIVDCAESLIERGLVKI